MSRSLSPYPVPASMPRLTRPTSSRRFTLLTALVALIALAPPRLARAQSEPPPAPAETGAPGSDNLVEQMAQFEAQLDQTVVSSTKAEQRATEAPAVITVVTAEEIQARGYRSLADVLREVPGFYDVSDLVTHNVGIRGINGGARASGNVLKLMIDGQAVDYRPTTGNFFGEELIPVEAIARVEIIRGPASALYGANAFLGVVNVITKQGKDVNGVELTGFGNVVRSNPGGGGGVMVGGSTDHFDALVAVGADYVDRSGLDLPASSPALSHPVTPAPAVPFAERGASQHDLAQPGSVLVKAGSDVLGGRFALLATLQKLDSGGEFQDFGPLTHGTRVAMLNQHYRASYDAAPSDKVSLQAAVQYFRGGPTGAERLDIGRPDYVLLRESGVEGMGASAEVHLQPHSRVRLTVGADAVKEDHLLQTFQELRPNGAVNPEGVPGEHTTFRNLGAFAQGIITFTDSLSATVGARVDDHNVYGVNPSARLGLVYAPRERPLSLKLLYGSSFKAPSAVELYTSPMALGDILGNAKLQAQTAQTVELAAGYALPNERGELSVDLFGTDVNGRVEFLQHGLYLQAFNLPSETVVGGEAEARLQLAKPVHLRANLGVAKVVEQETAAMLSGLPLVTQPLYPVLQAHLLADFLLPWGGLRIAPELAFVSARETSQSNALINNASYSLPAYLDTALSISTAKRRLFADTETSAALRVDDLLDTRWAEPSVGGIDVPSMGRTAFLTVVQSF